MKKYISAILSTAMLFSMTTVVCADESVKLYVDVNAEENGDGSFSAPFKTIVEARDAIRAMKKSSSYPNAGVTVYLREGKYNLSSPVYFTEEDSGYEGAPITYRAYPNESVSFIGGVEISLSDCQVSKNAGFPEEVDGKIYSYSLRDNAIAEYDKLYCTGHSQWYVHCAWPDEVAGQTQSVPEVFYNDKVTTIARYPNADEYSIVREVVSQGFSGQFREDKVDVPMSEVDGFSVRVDFDEERLEKLKKEKNAWMHGYWRFDWSDMTTPIKNIDVEQKVLTSEIPSPYSLIDGQRFYVFNAISELDVPGEWYLDKDTGMFYIYPPDNNNDSKILLAFSSEVLFDADGLEYVNFRELDFKGTRSDAIKIREGNHITIFGSVVNNVSGCGINVSGENITIDSCHIYNTGGRGIDISGGNFETLESGNNLVTNNWVHDFGRLNKTYYGAINYSGVGITLRFNRFHSGPHLAIGGNGNDNVLEYNEIFDVLQEAADAGAIYIGRSMIKRGSVIRGNVIHDLFSDSEYPNQIAIYLDDNQSGFTVTQNLIYNVVNGVDINGGRDNIVTDNVFVNVENAGCMLTAMGLAVNWGANAIDPETYGIFEGGLHTTEPYAKYPHLADILEDDLPTAPKYNIIKDNISYKVGQPLLLLNFPEAGTNVTVDMMRAWNELDEGYSVENDTFEDIENSNYNIAKDLSEDMPNFDKMDFNKAGLITSRLKKVLRENAITLAVGKSMSYVNWERKLIDENNIEVVPEITDNLTYIPVRFLAEMLNAKVSYAEGAATIEYNGKNLTLNRDSNIASFEGSDYELAGAVYIKNERMYIPLRSVSELFEKEVFWDDAGLIIISDDDMSDVFDKDMILNLIDRMS